MAILLKILLIPVAICCEIAVLYQTKIRKNVNGKFLLLRRLRIDLGVNVGVAKITELFNYNGNLVYIPNVGRKLDIEKIDINTEGGFRKISIVNAKWRG